jgi:hypothetical protein
MAKAKAKEDFTGVPALVVTPAKAPAVSGNFEQVKAYLQKWKQKVLAMKMTGDNLEEVMVIKREAVQYRNSLAKIQGDVKRLYFNDPKAVFDTEMAVLLKVVGEVEDAADKVLAEEEEERVAGINEIIDHYIETFQERYGLDGEHLARVERKKSYYNKTAEEKARKDDIEKQFKDLKKGQDAYAAEVRLIEAACRGEPRLNVQRWIEDLRHDSAAAIVEYIAAEKQRLRELDGAGEPPEDPREEPPAAESAGYEAAWKSGRGAGDVLTGAAGSIDFESDFKGRTKSMKIELIYPCDLGDALTRLFEVLKQYGIKTRPVKEAKKKEEAA